VAEPGYELERIRQALATDPRVGEPELSVDLIAGRLLVTGSVPSRRVRDAIEEVAADFAAGLPVDNRVTVASTDAPTGEESIS
jgi:osmotically-inducible protein OsmY